MFKKVKNSEESTADDENQLTMDLSDTAALEAGIHNENSDRSAPEQSGDEDYEEHSAEDDFLDID